MKAIISVLLVVIMSVGVLAQVEFGDSEPIGSVEVVQEKTWLGWLWDVVTGPFTKEATTPDASLLLSEHLSVSVTSWMEKVPQNHYEEKCKYDALNSSWSGCVVDDGFLDVVHTKETLLEAWQEISDGEITIKVSPDLWCWQESNKTVICESLLDCQYGPSHIAQTENAGCTYQRYDVDDTTFTTSNYGNEKVLAKAALTTTTKEVTEQVTP